MKISLNWLKDYVAVGIPGKTLAHKFSMAGMEVERIYSVDGDMIFEIEVTPNRADCLSVLGIAREAAAILGKKKEFPPLSKIKWPSKKFPVTILDKEGCQQYIACVIEGVDMDKTPLWMTKRLKSIGVRSINNVVDIANFCLMETGQPLHAFDYDKLSGQKIIVRRAHAGETIVTIDNVERTLDPSILVIADARQAVAIAGIMGGKGTEVTAQTKNILLESAYFNPILIRRASRKLGLSSDSSYRFERGVDPGSVKTTAERAVMLILKNAGGLLVQAADVRVGKKHMEKPVISVSCEAINSFLGVQLTSAECQRIFTSLDFVVDKGDKGVWHVCPPSFRRDVVGQEDLMEEVARIIGYEEVPSRLPCISATNVAPDPRRQLRNQLKIQCQAQGFDEVVSYSMIHRSDLTKAKLDHLPSLRVVNPLSQDQEMMRPSLFPSLLKIVQMNMNHGEKDLKFFETGKIYMKEGERETLAMIMAGTRTQDWRKPQGGEEVDVYDLKGAFIESVGSIQHPQWVVEPQELPIFEPRQGAVIRDDDKHIGFLGKINQTILQQFGIKQPHVFYAELDLEAVYSTVQSPPPFASLSEYPAIVRDVSLAVPKSIFYQDVLNVIHRQHIPILSKVRFVEQYLGEKIAPDRRGIVISFIYQSSERTLTEQEVNTAHEGLVQTLARDCSAMIR
jgi:phenylalanyl-tRNA synthetase beta chain